MTEPSKNSQTRGRTPKAPPPKPKPVQAATSATRATRHAPSKKQLETQRQKLITLGTGAALGMALLALMIGLCYDQLWVPSQPVAQANTAFLSRAAYWQTYRAALAYQSGLSAQYGAVDSVLTSNQQALTLRSSPENEQVITRWQDDQLLAQAAAARKLQATDAEVNAQIVKEMGSLLPPVTPTTTLTPTNVLTPASAPLTSANLVPSTSPTPTLQETNLKVKQISEKIYDKYVEEIKKAERKAYLAKDDFEKGLKQQFLRSVLSEKLATELVPEATFVPTTTIGLFRTRHILLKVPPGEAQPSAATPTPDENEKLFELRRAEAEELVRLLRSGADFAALAKEKSDDPGSKDNGGDLSAFDKEGRTVDGQSLVPEFVQATLALEGDQISDPVRSQFGWHIIQVVERKPLDRANQLTTERDTKLNDLLKEQRQKGQVKRLPEPTPTPLPPTMPPLPTSKVLTGTNQLTGTQNLTNSMTNQNP